MLGMLKILLLIYQLFSISYNNISYFEYNDYSIEYGSATNDTEIDGYLKIYDSTGLLINESAFDDNGIEIFKYLALTSETSFIIVCDIYYPSDGYTLPVYRETVLLKYDFSGNLLTKEYLNYKPINYFNHNYCLILKTSNSEIIYNNELKIIDNLNINNEFIATFSYQFQGQALINGVDVEKIDLSYPGIYFIEINDGDYNFSFTITLHPDYMINGIRYEEGYLGTVKVFSFGELYINGDEYLIGSSLTEVGNYTLIIKGENDYHKEVNFVILPDVVYNDGTDQEQLMEDSEFMTPIRIFSNSQAMFLNDEIYSSDLIDLPGVYTLTLIGINNYQEEISFTIIPSVSGIENNETYQETQIDIFGKAYLNGEEVTGEVIISENGDYKLELILDGEVYRTYNFRIEIIAEVEETNENQFEEYYKYIFLIILVVGLALILRKK